MGVVLPPLATATATPAARTSEGRPRRVLLLPPRGLLLVTRVVAATGDAPASAGLPGPRGPRDARCCVFDAEPWAARLQRAGRGMSLCTELGDVSEFHAGPLRVMLSRVARRTLLPA